MMNNEGYSLTDLAAVTNGGNGLGGSGSAWWIIILFLFCFMGGGFGYGNRTGELGQYATAASQQQILFNQQFDALGTKINAIGDGICSASYALNNQIRDVGTGLGTAIAGEGRALQMQLSNGNAALTAAIHAEGEATRKMMYEDKIATMQGQINNLQLQNAVAGVVRYPMASTYSAGMNPYCGCGNI